MSEKEKYILFQIFTPAPALKNNRERELLLHNGLTWWTPRHLLLGDILIWFEYKVVPRGFTAFWGARRPFRQRRAHPFFTGNHDSVDSRLPAPVKSMTLHRNHLITEIKGKSFSHGDGLDPGDKAYLFVKKCSPAEGCSAALPSHFAFYLAHRWSEPPHVKSDTKEEFKVKNECMFRFAENYLKGVD